MAVTADGSAWGVVKSVLGLLAGLVLAFSGYRLARGLAGFAGFLAGFVLGLALGLVAGPIGSLVMGLVLGVLFAILFVMAFHLVGAALGAAFMVVLAMGLGWPTWAVVLLAILGGIVGLAANKPVIAAATALAGAWLAVGSAIELWYDAGQTLSDERLVLLVGTVAVGALGLLSQMRSLRQDG